MPSALPSARRRALLVLPVLASLVACSLAATPAGAAEHRVQLPGARPAVSASAAGATPVAATDDIEVEVAFDLRDQAGAEALATSVSTPGSPDFRRFVAPADWIARFSPAAETVDAFLAVAQQAGLEVDAMPESRLFVVLRGSADEVERLFATDLRAYDVHGQRLVVPVGSVSLPAAAAEGVRAAQFDRLATTSRAATAAGGASTVRCSAWWGQRTVRIPEVHGSRTAPTALCGYSAEQLRAASGVAGTGLTGAGQTIAVIDAFGSGTIVDDLATWSRRNGLPRPTYTQRLPERSAWRTSPACSPADWKGEQTLDLEAAHAIAPAAALLYVGAADCRYGFDVAMSRVLDGGLASIVSNSYGMTAGDTLADPADAQIAVNTHQHLQAAAQGIGLYFASGDAGDNAGWLGTTAVDFPASSPWVTAVGGTTTALDRQDRVVFRAAWGDRVALAKRGASSWSGTSKGRFVAGAGGGVSTLFAAPAYQAGAVPASLARGNRVSTDVSALADPFTGLAVGMRTGGRYRVQAVGGTSLAAPIVAAQMALVQQQAGGPIGFANPALYAARDALTDVRPSTTARFAAFSEAGRLALVTFDRDSSLRARGGYDQPTGLGVLTADAFAALAGR